jgi:biopolymer transport protein ExbD
VESEEMDSINVVPLVDVMLVLLTIVLTTATFVVNGRIPVDLASSKTAQATQVAPIVITLTAERLLYMNDKPVPDLATALGPLARDSLVVVRADGRLALSAFVDLVDQVKSHGFKQVSLEVKRT